MNRVKSRDAEGGLFISYDGLLDPLGESQILPYVRGLARGRRMHVLSFEKPARFSAGGQVLAARLREEGIEWRPLRFSQGAVGKAWDLLRMYATALWLGWRRRILIAHCRGHLAAQVGYLLKRVLGMRLLFDFRGLWVDERVDKGSWDLARRSDRLAHALFKRTERRLVRASDHIVVLTHAVILALQDMGVPRERITVIPCCADFTHFTVADATERAVARQKLGLPVDGTVMCYLGSIGPMYMTDKFLDFAEAAVECRQASAVLCITPDLQGIASAVESRRWTERGIPHVAVAARRDQVPGMLAAADVLVSFFLPTPARMGTSPTKMAECFAQGIPMVTNPGVGDVAELLQRLSGGLLVDASDSRAIRQAAQRLQEVASLGGDRLRAASRPLLGLEQANARYQTVYQILESGPC